MGVTETPMGPPAGLGRVHMVGIGGAGMSGVARILLARGASVSGSDAKESRGVLALRARGADVRIGHDAAWLDLVPGGAEVLVTSLAAIPADNPELVEARRRGIPVITRSEALAALMEGHGTVLVAGTHGKTSTTSMAVVALQACGMDPSFAIGGSLNESGTNAHHGNDSVFVAEADESDGSLLQYSPDTVIVTNVEPDHLDHFGTEAAYRDVFERFVDRIRPGGLLVVCLDDPGSRALARYAVGAGVRVLGYGTAAAVAASGDLPVGAVLRTNEPEGSGSRSVVELRGADGAPSGEVLMRLGLPGLHMSLNACAALLAGIELGGDPERLLDGLRGFGGVNRRFQFHGIERGVRVYDDYAHHPTECRAVLAAARGVLDEGAEGGRLIVVFQPHLYSRTRIFAAEFAEALSKADEVVVLDVFGARELPEPGVSGLLIADAVTVPAHFQPDFSAVPVQVAAIARPGDLVITMGAGDVTILADQILRTLRGGPGAE